MSLQFLACSCGAACGDGATTCASCRTYPSDPPVEGPGRPGDTGRAYPLGGVLGSYRLLEQIGAGGMGRVFIAEHIRLGRKVALKALRSEFSCNPEAVKRFFAEARAVNCISHENIIEVSDFVENPRGPSFYIMELLHGMDLGALQARDGVLPLPRALRIAVQVCSALGAAHGAGIIHRDLKPDNIFLTERPGHQDFVKLLDFGVAKLMNGTVDDASTFRTGVGMVVGTPNYMAPEQALGHPADHLADVYAVGVILFEMVAGRRPFVANTAREVMAQHLTMVPPSPSRINPVHDIPDELEELILACLSKDPAGRPESIQEVEQRLRAILEALPARRGPLPSRARRWRSRPALVGGAALLLVVAVTLIWVRAGGLLSEAPLSAAETRPAASRGSAHARTSPGPGPGTEALTVIEAARAPAANSPIRAAVGAMLVKTIDMPASLSESETERPRPIERRRVKLDRGAVLNPFE